MGDWDLRSPSIQSSLFDSSWTPLLLCTDLVIISANQELVDVLGYPSKEALVLQSTDRFLSHILTTPVETKEGPKLTQLFGPSDTKRVILRVVSGATFEAVVKVRIWPIGQRRTAPVGNEEEQFYCTMAFQVRVHPMEVIGSSVLRDLTKVRLEGRSASAPPQESDLPVLPGGYPQTPGVIAKMEQMSVENTEEKVTSPLSRSILSVATPSTVDGGPSPPVPFDAAFSIETSKDLGFVLNALPGILFWECDTNAISSLARMAEQAKDKEAVRSGGSSSTPSETLDSQVHNVTVEAAENEVKPSSEHDWMNHLHPDFAEKVKNKMVESYQTGLPFDIEILLEVSFRRPSTLSTSATLGAHTTPTSFPSAVHTPSQPLTNTSQDQPNSSHSNISNQSVLTNQSKTSSSFTPPLLTPPDLANPSEEPKSSSPNQSPPRTARLIATDKADYFAPQTDHPVTETAAKTIMRPTSVSSGHSAMSYTSSHSGHRTPAPSDLPYSESRPFLQAKTTDSTESLDSVGGSSSHRQSNMAQEEQFSTEALSEYRWYLCRGAPLKDPKTGNVYRWIGTTTDIHDGKRASLDVQKLMLSEKSAQEANRLKSEFLAVMSHEMRTPLTGVMGVIELLKETPMNSEQVDYVAMIDRSAKILANILDFSKIEAGKLDLEISPVDVRSIMADVAMILSPQARSKDIELRVERPDTLPLVYGDPSRLAQVLLNLVGNAVKFTEKGSVLLQVQVVDEDADSVSLQFVVADTGIGISASTMGLLFSPFSQADKSMSRRYGGSGLGLVISQRLLEMMGSEIKVKSKYRHGTTFWFVIKLDKSREERAVDNTQDTVLAIHQSNALKDHATQIATQLDNLWAEAKNTAPVIPEIRTSPTLTTVSQKSLKPLQPVEPVEQAHVDPNNPFADTNRYSILVAEDNDVNKIVIQRFLAKFPWADVTLVNDGVEALEAYHSGTWDIILLDQSMPRMSGDEVCRAIREVDKEQVIISLSANALLSDQEHFLAIGMNDHISKPIDRRILEQKLRKWITFKLRKE
ncbi:hypothetical protein BZG36_02863 [Bifiguratus adelaidae]|uniref:Histidine kinase n=1 Tax=Bifiguratus adelaidae TaxID=1938954 RepID=A0A261Y0I1_9FUNG|nr:hypothetical protein BZG36_02863 [Bifiguratus adelaidae]